MITKISIRGFAWLMVVILAAPAGALGQQSSAAPVFKQEELDLVKGQMIGGFAVIAYPTQYGNSGVMTFIVNHEGKVFQKNLGKNTASIAAAMREYNPDSTWSEAKE